MAEEKKEEPQWNKEAKTLAELGYHFNDEGKLRNIEDGSGFKWVNQAHYEKLALFVLEDIQKAMREKHGLIEHWLPIKNGEDGTTTEDHKNKVNIFYTKDWTTNTKGALILIQGTGAVRAGQWARKCCINDSLTTGTVLPQLERAAKNGWSVIVFNPNYNRDPETKSIIMHNESMEAHCSYVYRNFVLRGGSFATPADDLYMVSHSAGGYCTVKLVEEFYDDLNLRLKRLALTDSAHSGLIKTQRSAEFFKTKAYHWIASDKPLNTRCPERDQASGCTCVSAGHKEHEYTTGVSREAFMNFLEGGEVEPITTKPSKRNCLPIVLFAGLALAFYFLPKSG
mmetsp:Transcript_19930/g.22580  ORF Transcript_19930/g.22580 Transcript_19930/m.22580 type:complete len:339 (-) Transcript_19930:25-1041(-)